MDAHETNCCSDDNLTECLYWMHICTVHVQAHYSVHVSHPITFRCHISCSLCTFGSWSRRLLFVDMCWAMIHNFSRNFFKCFFVDAALEVSTESALSGSRLYHHRLLFGLHLSSLAKPCVCVNLCAFFVMLLFQSWSS